MKATTVVIADEHPVFRDGLADAINRHHGLTLVGRPGTGEAAIQEVRRRRPDVLVIDVNLAGLQGMTVLRSISAEQLPTRSLVISASLDSDHVYGAISAGASGYLSKGEDSTAICAAIEAVARGQTVWPPAIQHVLADEIRGRGDDGARDLSPREIEILKLVADGQTTSAIAGRLYLSPATVKTHLHRSFGKLGVKDRAAAVAEGLRRGLFD